MIKKTLFIGGGICLLLMLLFGGKAFSYVGTLVKRVQNGAQDKVPMDFKLEDAQRQINRLTPEIKKNKTTVAREEVAVERLAMKVRGLETELAKDQQQILRLTGDLKAGKSHYVYVGTSYSAQEVEADLARRFEEFKTDKATLGTLQKVLNAREDGLGAARKKLQAMQNAQSQLRFRVENLAARAQMVEVAEANGAEMTFDQSKLAKTRELVDELEARIRTAEKVVRVDPKTSDRILLEEEAVSTPSGEIQAEISKYFGANQDQ